MFVSVENSIALNPIFFQHDIMDIVESSSLYVKMYAYSSLLGMIMQNYTLYYIFCYKKIPTMQLHCLIL